MKPAMARFLTDPAAMEPMLPAEGQHELEDAAFDLVSKASSLAGQMHPLVISSVGTLVRSMNCYYSNLVEGHHTHPHDIDRALHNDYAADPIRRVLQREAVAHTEVQRAIDEENAPSAEPASSEYTLWLHREFCVRLPDELLWVEDSASQRRVHVEPGLWRTGEVIVGRHLSPAAAALPEFLARFERAYDSTRLSKPHQVVAIAAAHHRFLWIHPFYDGNGRVARQLSHAMLKRVGIGSSLWSVARGLARNVTLYKALLMEADQPRQSALDGRGALSHAALLQFCHFFLMVCIDQIDLMRSLLTPSELLRRIELYTEDEIRAGRLPKGSFPLLREALLAGQLERGQAPSLTGYQERMARMVLAKLLSLGLLVSDCPKAPVRLGFPIAAVERWVPALYPDSLG